MTKKKAEPARKKISRPRVPGTPRKRPKKSDPLGWAEKTRQALADAYDGAFDADGNFREPAVPYLPQGVELPGAEALKAELETFPNHLSVPPLDNFVIVDDSVEIVGQQAVAQPVDLSPFNLQASRKEARQKQTIETGNGWRCLNCMRVLSTRIRSCPYCRQRRKHSYSDQT